MNKTKQIISFLICSIFFISPSFSQQNVSQESSAIASNQAANTNQQTKGSSKHILVFGDSLSAAYGIDVQQGWVHLLGEYLKNDLPIVGNEKNTYQISNASISGETTTGGLARIELTLQELKPDLVLLALGANDGLQGQPIPNIENNLNNIIDIIEQNNTQVVVLGISIPASYGPRYIDEFRNIFPTVAEQRKLHFVDLYQEEFFTQPGYMQNDGLHPTAKAQPIVRDLLIDFLTENELL